MSWSIKNYNAFVREVRSEYGVSYREAQQVYSIVRDSLGRSAYGVDIERHPRITGRAVDEVREDAEDEKVLKECIDSWEEWEDAYDDADFYDSIDAVSTADYGKKR